jgi:hypothetical protein
MANEPKLVVALEARLNKFEGDLKQAGLIADREVRNIEDKFSKANPKFSSGFLGGLFSALSVGALTKIIQDTVQSLAKIGDQSERIGITAEQLQELRYALEQNGGEANQAGPALERFANNIAKAMEGEGKLARFLTANNVALKDRNGTLRPTADLLADVANLIQNAATPQERLNIATEFFGRTAGPAMATALANGSSGLRTLGNDARNAGAVLDNELIKKAQEIDDKFQKMARTLGTTLKGAIISLIDTVQDFTSKAGLNAALESGTYNAKQLADAIALARSKGSPVDPSWIADLERLRELERERKSRFPANTNSSALPLAENKGGLTNTRSLHTRPETNNLDAFERAIYQSEKRIEVMRAENAVIDEGSAARERARLIAELETAAKERNRAAGLKNVEVTSAQRAEIDRMAESMYRVALATEQARSPLNEFAREARRTADGFENFGVSSLRSFEDALVSLGDKTTSTSEKFKKMTASILSDLGRLLIRQNLTGPLAGVIGGLFSGGASDPWSGIVPGRAGGGPVTAGNPYIVGESGRELFVPRQDGMIIPNHAVKAPAGSSMSVMYSPTIDARGADSAAVARLEQTLAKDRATFESRTIQAIQRAHKSNVKLN